MRRLALCLVILAVCTPVFAGDPAAGGKPEIRKLTARATPFFLRHAASLCRAVDVNICLSQPAKELMLTLETAGRTIDWPVRRPTAFTTVVEEVGVPAPAHPAELKIVARIGASTTSTIVRLDRQQRWLIFVAPSAHTDIGYTDVQPKCAERHCQNIDRAVALCNRFPQFCWNIEAAWQAESYLHLRSGRQLADFLRLAAEGRIAMQTLYCNELTGLCSAESAVRLTWFAHQFCRQHAVPFRSAMISDVPTQEGSLPMLLAGAGIRYFSSGSNIDRSYPFHLLHRKSPFWWEGPDGSRVLMMVEENYAYASRWSLDTDVPTARAKLAEQLAFYDARRDYPYDAIFLHGGVSDNCQLNAKLPEVVRAWNERYEFPRLIISPNAEFFKHIEERYGRRLPVYRGSGGTYWEDGAGSSARETTLCRHAKEAAASGERLLALAGRIGNTRGYSRPAIYDIWRNCILYDEHTWGSYCSIGQPESDFTKAQWTIKAKFAEDAHKGATELAAAGAQALAALVRSDEPALVVINPLSWPRTDVLKVALPEGVDVADPGVPTHRRPEGTFILVRDVPACGYRVIKLGPSRQNPAVAEAEGNVIESRFYRVEFDPATGGVVSIRDKELGQELVDPQKQFQLNQYVYAAGGDGSSIIARDGKYVRAMAASLQGGGTGPAVTVPPGPEPKLTLTASGKSRLRRLRGLPVGEAMFVESSGTRAPKITSEIHVWNDMKRIDFVNHLTKEQTYKKEAVYFAFPFAGSQAGFRYEGPASIVDTATGMLPGACLDWFTVQHFVEVRGTDAAITWATPDCPLVTLGDINRGRWQTQLPSNGHVYAYVMNNYWFTNYKAGQGGDYTFRFSITSRSQSDKVASARFGWSASNPLVAVVIKPNAAAPLPAAPTTLLSVAEPNVIITGTKLADEGSGLIVRLWELSGRTTTAHLRLDSHIPAHKATACNLVEEPQQPLTVGDGQIAVPVRGSGLATVRID